MFILGIDPGINGALALWSLNDLEWAQIESVYDLPTYGDGSKRRMDGVALASILRQWPAIERAWVELVTAMPSIEDEEGVRRGMGAASAFKFGEVTGGVACAIEAVIGRRVDRVVPQVWKRHHGLTGKPKSASRALALKNWPELAESLCLVKHEHRAEAVLIGKYGVDRIKRDRADDKAIRESFGTEINA